MIKTDKTLIVLTFILFSLNWTRLLVADTNQVEVMASCTILGPVELPELNDNLVAIVDYDPRIVYTPETRIIVKMTTVPTLKARFYIEGVQNNKLFNFTEPTNGIYYGGYKVQNEDVKRNTHLSVKLIDPLTDEEKVFHSGKLLQIDHVIYKDEQDDRIVISQEDPKTRVYILKDSLFEDAQVTIRRTNNFKSSIAYDFQMISAATKKKLHDFRKKDRIDIHFQLFNKDKVEEIGMSLSEASQLMIYSFDGVQWIPVGGQLDQEKQIVSADINHFSIYAIREMDHIEFRIGPNPFTPNNDGINDKVMFYIKNTGQEKVQLKIFKLNGSQVRDIQAEDNQATGMAEASWDGRDFNRDLCEDGLYIYQIIIGKKHYNGIVVLAK